MNVERYWQSLINPEATDNVELVGHRDMGRTFNRHAYRVRLASLERALKLVKIRPEWKVFEAAYGVGFYLAHWRRMGHQHVAGVDLAQGAFDLTRKAFPTYDLRLGDISGMSSWPDWESMLGTFDIVTAIDVIYHVVADDRARAAVLSLGRLVAPGQYLVVTDKFTGLHDTLREGDVVTRRPLSWYSEVLAPAGLRLLHTLPMMWCTDPPTRYGGPATMRIMSRVAWMAARAPLKWLPVNGMLQRGLGEVLGASMAAIDLRALPHFDAVPNLMIAIFQRQ